MLYDWVAQRTLFFFLTLVATSHRCESPEPASTRTRDFDFDSIYGENGGSSSSSSGDQAAALEATGWGPPMANLMVTGLPPAKDKRAEVKKALRAALDKACGGSEAASVVNGLTWGSKWGSCFVGMQSPTAASAAIVHLNEKPFLFKGIATRTLKLCLDSSQGRQPPPIPDRYTPLHDNNNDETNGAGGGGDGGSREDEDGDGGDGDDEEGGGGGGSGGGGGGASSSTTKGGERAAAARARMAKVEQDQETMPMSFTSRQGKIEEGKEVARERRWLQDTRCWCSICGSDRHAHKVCRSV